MTTKKKHTEVVEPEHSVLKAPVEEIAAKTLGRKPSKVHCATCGNEVEGTVCKVDGTVVGQ